MLIGLTGPQSSGKTTAAIYLKQRYGFLYIKLGGGGEADATYDHIFANAVEAMDVVMENWRHNIVIEPICQWEDLETMAKRPFFLLVSIDAPISLRFERMRGAHSDGKAVSLEEFVQWNDCYLYGSKLRRVLNGSGSSEGIPCHDVYKIMAEAQVNLLNAASSVHEFLIHLDKHDLLCNDRLRPGWDTYFMKLCTLTAQRSNCMKRRVGCILVRNKRIIATGYNGTPRGVLNCNQGGCERCNNNTRCGHGLDTCLCLHAEENALLEAGRERIGNDTILYCSTCPCLGCAKKIVQMGISEVVYSLAYGMDNATKILFLQAGVGIRQHKLLTDNISDEEKKFKSPVSSLELGQEFIESLLGVKR